MRISSLTELNMKSAELRYGVIDGVEKGDSIVALRLDLIIERYKQTGSYILRRCGVWSYESLHTHLLRAHTHLYTHIDNCLYILSKCLIVDDYKPGECEETRARVE